MTSQGGFCFDNSRNMAVVEELGSHPNQKQDCKQYDILHEKARHAWFYT